MSKFKQYKRKGLSEMISFSEFGSIHLDGLSIENVSISEQDKLLPQAEFEQGYIARNPKNHADMWYVAKKYFDDNLEEAIQETSTTNCSFGQAINALKDGKRVAREGWNGKGLFVFMQVPSEISKDIVPKMQSLPKSVKDEFQRRFDAETHLYIRYSNQMAIVNQKNEINGWTPSGSDALAEDWMILD